MCGDLRQTVTPAWIAEDWKEVLQRKGFVDFDALWTADAPWYEPRNQRRGGWSGVSYIELEMDGRMAAVYLKRQQDHNRRSLRHPLKGVATYELEWQAICRYQAHHIATLTPVYFASRRQHGHQQTILITEALNDYISLEQWVAGWQQGSQPGRQQRIQVINAVAKLMAQMHACHFQHNSLYPKHLFLSKALLHAGHIPGEADVRIIDLESNQWRWRKQRARLRDLDSLNRYSSPWSLTDRARFLQAYLGIDRLTPVARSLWKQLTRKHHNKN
ncbi:MAG: lipopolysaccharide kinase InaA family protein [Gammaproteobacteria bacterium]|nr:MAG: lipopolysaccharide kinase InaA family protein [Gammaproteobacteria bacterium]